MNSNKALSEGDFTRIAETMRESGKELVSQLSITINLNIPDPGCGDGTAALPELNLEPMY